MPALVLRSPDPCLVPALVPRPSDLLLKEDLNEKFVVLQIGDKSDSVSLDRLKPVIAAVLVPALVPRPPDPRPVPASVPRPPYLLSTENLNENSLFSKSETNQTLFLWTD